MLRQRRLRQHMSEKATSSPSPNARRRLRRVLLAVAFIVVGAAAALVLAVRSLDRPWFKRHIQALVRSSAGLELDYRAIHVGATGLRIEDLVILSPPSLRAEAPELARIGAVEARWALSALTQSDAPRLATLSLRDVAVTLVEDVPRGSSLDLGTSPAPSPSSKPATPLSRQAAALLEEPPPVGRIELHGVRLTLIRAADGKVEERVHLSGLAAQLWFERDKPGSWRLSAAVGSQKAPLELAVARAGHGHARLSLAVEATATGSSAKAFADLRALEQTLVPKVSMERLLRVDATARFDPVAGRTEIALASLQAADDSIRAKAALVIPDQGALLLSEADGEIDPARALRHVPEGLVPVELDGGHVSFRVRALRLEAAPRLGPGGEAHLEASTRRLQVPLGGRAIDASAMKLVFDAEPKEGSGLAGRAAFSLDKVHFIDGSRKVDADGITATLDAQAASDGAWSGQADLRLAGLATVGPSISAAQAHFGMRIRGLSVDPGAPLRARGEVRLIAEASTLGVEAAPWRVRASDLAVEGGTRLAGAAPYVLDLDLPVRALELSGPGGRALSITPLKAHLGVEAVFPDSSVPLRTRGKAKIDFELGALHASLDLTKQVDAIDYVFAADASSLAAARSLMPEADRWKLPWDRLALALQSSGRVERLSSGTPKLTQRGELTVDRPSLTLPAGTGSADRLALTLRSEGDLARHSADAELSVQKVALGAEPHGDARLSVSAQIDAPARSLRLTLNGEGDSGPTGAAQIAVDFDRRAKKLSYDVTARLGRLAPFAPFLKGIDLAHFETAIAARGWLAGVVDEVGADGAVKLAPHPLATLGGQGTFSVQMKGLGWSGGDKVIAVPGARLEGEIDAASGRSSVRGHVKVDAARFVLGEREIDLADVDDHWEVKSADLAAGEVELDQRVRVGSAQQSFVAGYPVGELSVVVKASRDREGIVRAPLIQVDNAAAGTSLRMAGRAELGAFRRSVSLRAEVKQDLARAWSERETFEGKGTLGVRLRVDSTDLRTFHAQANARFTGVDLRLPKAGWAVESLDAEIPAQASVIVGAGGPTLRFESGNSPFAQTSFLDQQPFQERRTFLSIARLTTPAGVLAPLAGNLEISRGAVLLSQLELGVRKGLVTGQCELVFQGQEPTLIARVRASGVESSHGEPFDGNIAVSLSTRERRIEGRAEILRIGRRHLLDLLDIQDPYRADPSLNRIRTALALGYPEQVRLTFRQGFASLGVTFGGLARLLRLEEVRGIPVGPLLDKALAPLSKEIRP